MEHDHDASNILGHSTMPVALGTQPAESSINIVKLVFIAFTLFVSYTLGLRLWKRVLAWRERSYKLATRRRHGIPDNDLRPFNVAYSEAVMKAREEENRKQVRPKPSFRPQVPLLDQREALPEHIPRQRSAVPQRPDAGMRSTAIPVPGGYTSAYESHLPPQPRSAHDINRIQTESYNSRQAYVQPSSGVPKPLTRHGGYLNVVDNDGKKRSLDEEQDEEHEAKKSKMEGEELIDGDEDAEFDESAPKRGSKRGMRDEEESEDVSETKKARGKRARKVSQEKVPQGYQADQSMDIDDEEADEITELKSTSRGKKRDRAEAGSTFGGDDDDSAAEHEAEGDSKARRRRRKRRTVAKRKSEASYIRGKKREREDEDNVSDYESEESSPAKKSSRKKRGKHPSTVERRDSKSDISMDESTTSTKTKVREIGDEWESNGIKYKIGPNGQRLRQALVKKARQKFVMPKDSQHPDRDANLQVCIECWLTEEEFQNAKAEHMLAWQDSPNKEEETEKLSLDISQGVPFPQSAPGKSLLWSSSTSTTPTISPPPYSPTVENPPEAAKHRSYRDAYRHSIATTVGLPIRPFGDSTVPSVKRIASNTRALSLTSSVNGSPGLSDSTNGSPRTSHKVFSKWEKQELEAKAMMKMREANRKKELEREAKLKEEKERAERAAAEKARLERERQERERQERERERQERERRERERAEAERKAKEAAQNASVPSITVSAPSFAPPTAPAASATSSVPNFFVPSSTSRPAETTSTGQSSSFGHPSQPASTPAQGTAAGQTEPPKSTFSFGPTGGAASSAPTPGTFSFGTSPSTTASTEQNKDAATGATSGSGGGSLLSRMGTQAREAPKMHTQPAQPPFSAPSTATPSGATSTPKFSFGFKPAGTSASGATSAPTSAFPGTSSSSLSGALGSDASKTSGTTATSGSTFSFKTPSIPASTTNNAGSASTTMQGTTPPAAAPPAAPKFSFGTSAFGTQAQHKEPTKSAFGGNTAAATPFGNTNTASAFGTSSAPSAFGSNTNPPSAFGGASNTGTTSAFGGASNTNTTSAFGSNKNTSSAFGGNTSTTSPFGNTSTSAPSPFGATANQTQTVFGGGSAGASKPAEPQKPLFSFANPSSSTATSIPATSTATPSAAPKSTFGFGQAPTVASSTAPSTTIPASGSSGFSFKFGAPSSTTPQSSPFGAPSSTTPQSSPFGAAASSGQSVFGNTSGMQVNGTTTTTTTTPSVFGGGVFGGPSAPSQQQKQQ